MCTSLYVFIFLYLCLSVCLSLHICVCLSDYLLVCLQCRACTSDCYCIFPSLCTSIHPSVHLSVCPSVGTFVHPSTPHVYVCLTVRPSVGKSVCLCLSINVSELQRFNHYHRIVLTSYLYYSNFLSISVIIHLFLFKLKRNITLSHHSSSLPL